MSEDRENSVDIVSNEARASRRYRLLRRIYRRSRLRWALIVVFVILVGLILPKDFVREYSFEPGKTWVAPSLKAEFDFPLYKSEAALEEEKRRAGQSVPLVFVPDTTVKKKVLSAIERQFLQMTNDLRAYERAKIVQDEKAVGMKEEFLQKYKLNPDLKLREHPSFSDWQNSFFKRVEAFINQVYATGLVDTTKNELRDQIVYVQQSSNEMRQKSLLLEESELVNFLEDEFPNLPQEEQIMLRFMVIPRMLPNLSYSARKTNWEREKALRLVSPVSGMVKKDETIISKAERIGEKQSQKISSYQRARAERFGHPPYFVTFGGQLVLVTIITVLLVLFIRNNRPRIYFSNRKLALVLLVFLTMVGVTVLVLKLTLFTQEIAGLHYIFLVPVCMVTIILSAFFDSRFAFFGNLIIALFAGAIVPNGFEYFFIQVCAGTAAVYSLTRLRNRADFFIALSLIFLTYTVTYIGYSFYLKGNFTEIRYINLALFGLNVVLTFITYPLIYVFEKIFGLTSDLTFIELLDTNHPLLKELSVRAPGTFQHSIQVANITEAVLNRIGGNSLQAKVGALFHDIGKMQNPHCFIENLGDARSPHEAMTHLESAEVIIRHVTDGVKMAYEHNLPGEVVDYIKTHHGTTRTEYFFRKYVKENPDTEVDEALFTYPGPLPFTREMAVLMIADSIEAASRAMKDRSKEKLKSLIEGIVDSKVRQRQFNNAYLTFRDLEDAKEVIFNMLSSMYHGRIEYPDEPKSLKKGEDKLVDPSLESEEKQA